MKSLRKNLQLKAKNKWKAPWETTVPFSYIRQCGVDDVGALSERPYAVGFYEFALDFGEYAICSRAGDQ